MISSALGNQHTVVLHESGRISALGSNRQGQIPSASSRKRIQTRLYMERHVHANDQCGDKLVLLSTGKNAQGQPGRGYTVESTSPVDTIVSLPVDRAISSFVCGSERVLAAMSTTWPG